MIYAFIEANKAQLPIAFMCARLGVSRAGFYEWRARQHTPAARTLADRQLTDTIRQVHRQSRGIYGAPRVHAELVLGMGMRLGRKRIARLMRADGLVGVTRRRRHGSTRRDLAAIPSDDRVNRAFNPDGPDRLWVADITEHPTGQGKVFCAVVVDAWSRRVVGWSIADHLRAELVAEALEMARLRRRPAPDGSLVHHSDHGTQYTSWAFGQRLRHAGLLGSMGTVGDALDNAVAESFFASLQTELFDKDGPWPTRAGLARAIFDYIECFYNPVRRHSYNGQRSPIEFENSNRHTDLVGAA